MDVLVIELKILGGGTGVRFPNDRMQICNDSQFHHTPFKNKHLESLSFSGEVIALDPSHEVRDSLCTAQPQQYITIQPNVIDSYSTL